MEGINLKISSFLHDIISTIRKYDIDYDSFSLGQLESKEWLVEELYKITKNLGSIYVLCGWYGTLASMLFLKDWNIKNIRSFDIDDSCWKIADSINRTMLSDGWKFKATTKDIFNLNFENDKFNLYSYLKEKWFEVCETPDTIINTSCEHIDSSWFKKVPSGKIVVLQSNDFLEGIGHINCMTDLDEFKLTYPMSSIYYKGSMTLSKYNRFMLIGIK